ncbi:uncharacterized protein PGTG_17828 [Puccinia graminis f. sp. tritici CRL 75-36-700-3]|uniref:Uncharacterized protein n=1 Tax=Puccinia graminis f. sp. tritici (strain CRL 75-36-700-3 / race SCCL) TaxID=418459 RepID=E3L622_PUCGT|nr:uncharacterized protein PGTG_17828 [Puccinia graminis f. sp. tritici CRL 75-36-700-3]EFP91997.2 hypothetical protein PGTG_17828 [Puccinia graminis f. sp. tritici CRL 75-36-700-3]
MKSQNSTTVGSYPRIVVGAGKWVLHRGQHFDLVKQFHKAGVWGSGYVVSANYNQTSPLRSYLTVFNPSPKQGGPIQLLTWDSDIVKKMSCLKRGDWITFGGKAGIDSFKDTHIVESTLIVTLVPCKGLSPRTPRTVQINPILPQIVRVESLHWS